MFTNTCLIQVIDFQYFTKLKFKQDTLWNTTMWISFKNVDNHCHRKKT